MNDWRERLSALDDIDILRREMDERCYESGHMRERRFLLNDFLKDREQVDIVLLLYGASHLVPYLCDALPKHNVILYRPVSSHCRTVSSSFLEGKIVPQRTILFMDVFMDTGAAVSESANYFSAVGYNRENMFVYLDNGCIWKDVGTPELGHVDELLPN